MTNMINLKFPSQLSRISDYDYGKKIFDEQIKDQFLCNQTNLLVFPDEIVYVAISFVQGVIGGIYEVCPEINKNNIMDYIEVHSIHEKVVSRVIRNIRY